MAKLKQAGKLVNLARNGDFSLVHGQVDRWRGAEMARGRAARRLEHLAEGRLEGDLHLGPEAGAAGKGAAKASRVAGGCFIQTYKATPGERYAVRAACKVHGNGNAWLRVRWQTADGRWTAETQDQLFYCGSSPDNWQKLFGVVEVPEGVGRLLVLLSVEGQDSVEDAAWFDDVELYKLP